MCREAGAPPLCEFGRGRTAANLMHGWTEEGPVEITGWAAGCRSGVPRAERLELPIARQRSATTVSVARFVAQSRSALLCAVLDPPGRQHGVADRSRADVLGSFSAIWPVNVTSA